MATYTLKLSIKIAAKPLQTETWLLLTAYKKSLALYPMVPTPTPPPMTYRIATIHPWQTTNKQTGRRTTTVPITRLKWSAWHQLVVLPVLNNEFVAGVTNGMFTRSSKRPANFQQMYLKYTC